MTDIWLEWNSDFQVDATGDLLIVDGDDEVRQRLERRLFTAVQGYVWHPDYGAGLPQKIGGVYSVSQITSIVNAQIALEDTVAPSPAPQVSVVADPNNPDNVFINIKYWDKSTGQTVSFQIAA